MTFPDLHILNQAFREAMRIVFVRLNSWPDDDWISIGDDWDLNLFFYDGQQIASLYPVIDGKTQTHGFRVNIYPEG